MFIGRRLGSFLVVILLCTAGASAQQPSPPTQAGSDRIYLQVEVTEKSGQPVADLQQQDFTLLDNKAAQTITSFRAVSGREASLEAIVVIDAVNAPYQSVSYERVQIDKFLGDEEGNLAYPVALVVVTDNGTQIVGGFSNDGKALSALLDKADVSLRDVGRSAGYYGAEERLQLSL
ncbi:MAG: hypothetical protein WBD87_06130, partial [Candidatus Acidiferrales bacterium]